MSNKVLTNLNYKSQSSKIKTRIETLWLVWTKAARQTTGSPSSSCEMIIFRNKSHGEIIRVCMGVFTTALRNKKNKSNSQ